MRWLTGSVTAVYHDKSHRVQNGLISLSIPGENGGPLEVVGVDALAFDGNKLYGVATSSCQLPPGLPSQITRQLGHILRLDGRNAVKSLTNVGNFECTNNPDGQEADTGPIRHRHPRGTFYVADAAGNDVVKVRRGKIGVATVLSTDAQPVPTSLAFGPDHALFIGTLNFQGGPGGASVYRLAPGSDTATPYATGLTAITGIAFDGPATCTSASSPPPSTTTVLAWTATSWSSHPASESTAGEPSAPASCTSPVGWR